MADPEVPCFLEGTFLWGTLGYNYSKSPPVDLLAPSAFASKNPWIVLAAALEHAKVGDHSRVRAVEKLIYIKERPSMLVRAAMELWGDAGTDEDLRPLQSMMIEGDDFLREEACGAARCAGCLWLVPSMLETWRRATHQLDRDTISCMLSQLLEEESGPIAPGGDLSPSDYLEVVEKRIKEIRADLDTDGLPILAGKVFGVISLAQKMYRLTRSDEELSTLQVLFLWLRHKFETSTGVDCSSFFKKGEFQPLSAAAILEEFLEGDGPEKYKEGVRYFFGHRIPD